jgi:hypothetical protein
MSQAPHHLNEKSWARKASLKVRRSAKVDIP